MRCFFFCPGCFVAAEFGEEEYPTGFGDGVNPKKKLLNSPVMQLWTKCKWKIQQIGEATPELPAWNPSRAGLGPTEGSEQELAGLAEGPESPGETFPAQP